MVSELNDRIKELIETEGIKKSTFAAKINVSQAFVSQLCSGASQPSDRTIADICREFGVSEEWLRNGKGDMFIQKTESEELSEFFGELLKDKPDFRIRLISVLARLSVEEWEMLENLARKLAEEIKKEGSD